MLRKPGPPRWAASRLRSSRADPTSFLRAAQRLGRRIMDHRRSCLAGAFALVLTPLAAMAAEGDQVHATIDKPAVVTATPAPERGSAGGGARVVVSVTAFQPPQDGGPVQVVVKAQRDGTEREIGRFGITPHTAFKADERSRPKSFGLALPSELASGGPIKLNVYLVPTRGEGRGARLEVGGAEIR